MDPSHRPRKVCLVGTSAVGKTSLVSRFVRGQFSDRYLTTIGVKIDRKTVETGKASVDLVVWDLNGDDRFQSLQIDRLRGASGYLLVADGTRRATLAEAVALHGRIEAAYGALPFVLALNKADLDHEWELGASDLSPLEAAGWALVRTSARTGDGVEDAFVQLARRLA